MADEKENGFVEVEVERSFALTGINVNNAYGLMRLKEVNGDRLIETFVNVGAIDGMTRAEVCSPKTTAYKLIKQLSELGGIEIKCAMITLNGSGYHVIILAERHDGKQAEMECEFGDAVAVAFKMNVPIYVHETVLAANSRKTRATEVVRQESRFH